MVRVSNAVPVLNFIPQNGYGFNGDTFKVISALSPIVKPFLIFKTLSWMCLMLKPQMTRAQRIMFLD
jgi:hypothetical protein